MDCMNKNNGQDTQASRTDEVLHLVYGDCTLGVSGTRDGKRFRYLFAYGMAFGLESLVVDEKEWLYRSPKPTFWRAVTDNDRGNGFPNRSGMWLAADTFPGRKDASLKVDGKPIFPPPIAPFNNQYSEEETAGEIEVTFVYDIITEPRCEVSVTYIVKAGGDLNVRAAYKGVKGLPEMPVFGLRLIMPTLADGYQYEGLSGETYPDRMAGGIPGVYEVDGLPVTPYMVPQDCQMHMDTKWVEVYRTKELDSRRKEWQKTALKVCALDQKFAFSCIPYTAEELENATHMEELPPARRTVLCIYGAVRGVGGIDSWGADVEPAYHVSAEQDMEFEFGIRFF